MGVLPDANPNAAKKAEQNTYYLWHVWDIVGEHGTKKMADEKRVAFSRKLRSLDTFTVKERLKKGIAARKVKPSNRRSSYKDLY